MATLSVSWATLRAGLLDYLHERYGGTTSIAGAALGASLVDSTLNIYPANKFDTWWALVTSGLYATQYRRVATFTKASGTVVPESNWGGVIAQSVTYELMRFHPEKDLLVAVNSALRMLFPHLRVSRVNESLISGNALPNSDFEDWTLATTPDKWAVTTVAAAKEVSTVFYGKASLKVTGGASAGYVACTQATWPWLLDLSGEEIDFKAWVKASDASHARLQIVDDDGTTSSSYHTGGGTWELLKATRTIKTGTKTIEFRCCGAVNTKIAYFDFARATGGNIWSYLMPLDFTTFPPRQMFVQNYARAATGDEDPCDTQGEVEPFVQWPDFHAEYNDNLGIWLLRLTRKPTDKYRIRLVGPERFAALSADADTVPLSSTQAEVLYAAAAERLYSSLARSARGEMLAEHQAKAKSALEDMVRLRQNIDTGERVKELNFGNWRW